MANRKKRRSKKTKRATMKQQILDILVELDKWRATRKLSIESQREGYIRNIMEELGELADAIKVSTNYQTIDGSLLATYYKYPAAYSDFQSGTQTLDREKLRLIYGEHAYIDALCDIVVFAGNCVVKEKFEKAYIPWKTVEESFAKRSEKFLLEAMFINTSDMTNSPSTAIAPLYSFCKDLAAKKGYDFYKCMQETLKQINSRQGAWNEALKKWVKDTSDEAREKEYQADFDKCKLN